MIRSVRKCRMACRSSHQAISYRDKGDQASERTVWPFALGYFDRAQVLVAWSPLSR